MLYPGRFILIGSVNNFIGLIAVFFAWIFSLIITSFLTIFPGMPNMHLAIFSTEGFINSIGMDLDSNITTPKLPKMGFKDHAFIYSGNAQYFAINYKNILYFISTSPFAKVTRSQFSLGHWSLFQIPNSNIPTMHMDQAVAIPFNKFLWIMGGSKPMKNMDGFESMYHISFKYYILKSLNN